MYIYSIGIDEPDFGKEKVKSLGALISDLITGEATYLESLECIVNVSHSPFLYGMVQPHPHLLLGLHTCLGPAVSGGFPGRQKGNHIFKLGKHFRVPEVSLTTKLYPTKFVMFCRQFYMELLTYKGVQEICQCFKSHVSVTW